MKRLLITAAFVAASASGVVAQEDEEMVNIEMERSMLMTAVENGIGNFEGMDVDVDSLDTTTLTEIFLVLNGGDTESEKQAAIEAALN